MVSCIFPRAENNGTNTPSKRLLDIKQPLIFVKLRGNREIFFYLMIKIVIAYSEGIFTMILYPGRGGNTGIEKIQHGVR